MQAEWLVKRNCSLSPRQAGWAYGTLCAVILGVSLVFTLRGAWMVLCFAAIEVGALALALLHYTRHAADRERIALGETCLLVERLDAGKLHQFHLDPYSTRIHVCERKSKLIELESRGVAVSVGTYISQEAREHVAKELRQVLGAMSFLARPDASRR